MVTQASVKVLHAAPLAGPVNVYVTPGDAFTDADILAGLAGDPLLAGFEFGALTDYVPLTPNTTEGYDIRVIPVGTTTIAINIDNFPLDAGTVATVIARQPAAGGAAPTDFNVVVLTN